MNPPHVTEQRRVQGRRRVKTDAIDLEAITELGLTRRGVPVTAGSEVIGRLQAWAAHRSRRVATQQLVLDSNNRPVSFTTRVPSCEEDLDNHDLPIQARCFRVTTPASTPRRLQNQGLNYLWIR